MKTKETKMIPSREFLVEASKLRGCARNARFCAHHPDVPCCPDCLAVAQVLEAASTFVSKVRAIKEEKKAIGLIRLDLSMKLRLMELG